MNDLKPTHWIEKKDWLSGQFREVRNFCDISQRPLEVGHSCNDDNQRQTQVNSEEIVQLLHETPSHCLVRRYDGTLGWAFSADIDLASRFDDFSPRREEIKSPEEFFQAWEGTPYLWGGVSKGGIDCSGLTQRYYWDLFGFNLPKNSRDQRRRGLALEDSQTKNHDLVFVTTRSGRHHVGIIHDSTVWHASSDSGVVPVPFSEFLENYTDPYLARYLF